jgi:hypothetical protein
MAGLLRGIQAALSRLAPPPHDNLHNAAHNGRGPALPARNPSSPSPPSPYLSPTESTLDSARNRRVRLPDDEVSSAYSDDGGTVAPPSQGFGDVVLPRVVWVTEPTMKLKLRKRIHPLGVTRLTLGADMDLHTREIALKWSWKDRFFGGRLRFEGSQLSLSKRFDVDSRTHMYVRAAYDVHARKTLFSLDVKPFAGLYSSGNGHRPGLAIKQKVPLDKHVSAEVHARVQLPEARFSSNSAVSLGEGDVVVHLDELNLCFMLQ